VLLNALEFVTTLVNVLLPDPEDGETEMPDAKLVVVHE
jgi:hypothetical protein